MKATHELFLCLLAAVCLAFAFGCSDPDGGGLQDTSSNSDTDTDADTDTNTDSDGDTDTDSDTDTGNQCGHGIAARYPLDAGITEDENVLFADDFEGYDDASGLAANWNDGVYHNVEIVADPANVFSGSKALQFYNPMQDAELSNTVARVLAQEQEVLHLRFYSKFHSGFDVVGSSHNGGGISAHYYQDGQASPGIPANGTNKYLVSMEWWRGAPEEPSPGSLNVYVYHPEQRSEWGDHFFPDGTVLPWTYLPGEFGDSFVSRPVMVPEVDRWYCHELMIQANTPGELDGRIAMWVDGELVADFGNLRFRDVPELTIDRFSLSLHIGSNTSGETWKWYDNVVVATDYIGPMCEVEAP